MRNMMSFLKLLHCFVMSLQCKHANTAVTASCMLMRTLTFIAAGFVEYGFVCAPKC